MDNGGEPCRRFLPNLGNLPWHGDAWTDHFWGARIPHKVDALLMMMVMMIWHGNAWTDYHWKARVPYKVDALLMMMVMMMVMMMMMKMMV